MHLVLNCDLNIVGILNKTLYHIKYTYLCVSLDDGTQEVFLQIQVCKHQCN